MFRKALAILIVGSWVFLSAIDMLEDLDLANYLKIQAGARFDSSRFARGANLANNLVENGTRHIGRADVSVIIPSALENVGFQSHTKEAETPKKNLKIYKLSRAFRI
jgi:hypothetical protein